MRRASSATPVRNPALAMSRDSVLRDTPLSATRFPRSASSQGSRWATEDRLAIRRNPSFPIQQTAPKPYLAACAEITPRGRNWNAEFQLAWEMEDHSIEQAEQRMEALRQMERDFEREAAATIVKIVRLEKDMPHELPKFVQCFRVKNIFFRILPDSRSGRNYIASLRGILQSGSALLSVPLSIMFYYRGMPVLAQALVPMAAQPKRLYGANSIGDVEVEAEMAFIAEALHIALPDSSMEVYEALDGRYYVTNSNATLTPLFLDDTIMKRQEMLRTCPGVVDGADNTMDVIDSPALQDAVMQVCSSSPPTVNTSGTLTQLCAVLHSRGVNLCLLKQVARRLLFASNYGGPAVRNAVSLIACEMLSRTLKQEFYIEVQGKRIAYDEAALTRLLSKYFALVFAPAAQFQAKFLDTVSKKYGLTAEDDDVLDVLVSFRAEWRSRIMDRVCHLLGATIRKESGELQVSWRPFANSSVVPQLVDPRVAIELVETYTTVRTDPPHWHAFCLPLCWKVACWQRRFALALKLAREDAAAQRDRPGAMALVRAFMERCVCHVCFRAGEWPQVEAGRALFPQVLAGYEAWASEKTQGRRCTEYAFWLVDVAEGLRESPAELRSCVEEAVFYFQSAIARMPKYLRSEHGAWLHLQPYIGLLRCKKLLHSCSVDTQSLVQHSVELSKIGWASDFFINYLWDLGRELAYEGDFAGAIRVLRTAIALSKEKPTFAAELHTLLMDTAHVYRSWDLRLYATECLELTNEAIDYAAKYYGTASRQYGVVLNNRGAIEIELGRLDAAEETLRRAGAALDAAGVPHDDPDYLAYLRNLEALRRRRHPSEPAAVPLHSFLLRYPFLQTGCEDMPWDDVRPLEDGEFVRLARCRAQEAGGTAEAFRLEAAMKARVGSLFRRLLAGATLQRFPFLPPLIDGVYVESLRLQHDGLFQELATPWQRLPSGSEARRLQERLALAYVAVKVRRTQRRRAYEHAVERQFVDSFGSAVNLLLPVDVAELVEDAAVQQLTERYDAKAAHRGTAAELRSVAERIGERVAAWESEQWDWRQSLSAWVPKAQLHSFHLVDVAFDGPLRDLLTARQHAARTHESLLSPRELDARIEARCAALWERGQLQRLYSRSESAHLQAACRLASPRIRQQQLSSVFEDLLEPWSFSLHTTVELDDRDRVVAAVQRRGRAGRDVEVVEQWYPHLRALHCSGDVVAELPRRFDSFYHGLQLRWQQGGCSDAALHARLRLHIEACQSRARKARAGLMRDRLRTEAKYPFLRSRYEGIHLHDIKAEDDVVFREYYDEYARLASAARLPVRQMQACEGRMETRVLKLAKELRKREAALQQRFGRFLHSGDAAPLWCGAGLEYHPRMLQCEHYYAVHKDASAGSRPSRDAARCVQEIRSYARSAARDDYELRRLRSLADEEAAERYPFLSLRPLPSVPLSALPFECCYDFRREYAELCALMAEAAAVDADGADGAGSSVLSSPASMPSALSERIADKTQRLAAIVQEMAEEEAGEQQRLRHAYANIPMEVLGLPSTQLVLPAAFAELWQAAAQEGFRGDATSQAFGALCDAALDVRALTLANLYADEQYLLAQPFLLYHTRVCVSLRHLPLHDDQRYAALRQQYDSLLHHESYNSAVTSLQRVRLAARADRLALRTSQAWDNLLAQLPQSLSVENNQLHYLTSHADVYRGAARNARGKLTSTGKKQIIEALETSALGDVNQATADLRLRADLPFTAPHLHASELERDDHFTTLRKQLKTLRSAAPPSETALTNAEEAIRDYTAIFVPPTIEEIATPNTPPQPPQTARSRTPQRSSPQTPPREPPRRLPQDDLAARYPFLRLHDVDGWPEAIVADGDFQRLEAEYAELMRDPEANADALRAVEDAMNARGDAVAAALRQAAALQDLAARYPFLRLHDVEGWPEAIVADKDFQRLEAEYAELMRDPEANADALRAVEDAMNERGDAVAAALRQAAALQDLAARYPFLRLHDVEGWPEAIVADGDFQRLEAEYAELMRDPEANADALRAVEDAMNERGDAVAAALRQAAALQDLAARYPFLRLHDVEGWPEAIVADGDFQRLEAEYAELMRDPEANADALRAVEDAMNARGDAVAAALRQAAALQDLAARYPFLRLHDVEGWPEAIVADDDFQRLEAEYAELMRDPEANADALRAVEDAMNERGDAVAAALRQAAALQDLAARYPFLRLHDVEGWPEAIVADKDFQRLETEYAELMRDPEANADALRAVEDAMNERGDAVAAALRQAAALQDLAARYPFLRLHDVEGWPEAIVADGDFQRLEAEYAELMRDPEANADALRAVEDAMNARGDAVAAALRQAAALQDLAARYPFLRLHDVEGWPEAIVADGDFQRLEAEYAELMRDPEANADALRAVEDAMNERGDAVAAALRQAAALQDLAARYPFLRLHDVEGWPEAIVADGDFQRLEAEYAELMRDPEANADALRAVEDAMNARGDAVAAALRQAAALQDLAARYPFLRLHDVEGWPEAIVADKDFQRLEAEYAELMRDPEANADALRAVEDAMNARGDAVAAALRQAAALQDLAARYPFLRLHDVEGWPEAIVADGDFQRLEAEYAELMRDPEANADALRAVEDAMNARGDAVAAALRQAAALQDLAARYPFLRLHDVEGWPEAIVADKDFQRLETEYAELMRDPEANADALRAVEDAMNERGDAVAAALRQAAALQDLAARYPFLRLHDVEGWPEAIVADGDFQRLEAEYAELMRDPEANADALRAVEDAMNARGDAVAAALRQAAALQDLAARYPFLRLHDVEGWPEAIVADGDFQRLEAEYAELMRDPEANADALRAVEDAMNERGDAVAAALRQAAALQDLAARYPFLRLHDVEGWPEAIVADGDFQRLEAEYAELMRDPEANADALRAVEDAMNARGDAVAAALRQAAALQDLAARYPFLRLHDVEGWPEAIVADKDFQRLEAEYAELMRDPEANADALRAVEDAMNARGDAVAAALRQAAALQDLAARYPFLRLHDVEGWPEAIVADGDFQRLEAEYAELMRDPEANADALRAVEDAMNARGDAVAAALRQAAALQDLAARYPFLRLHDVEGWPEAIVADGDFQRLEAEYAELMRDPEANADALRAVEDAMNARGDAVAAALRQAAALQDLAARYPFLRLHDVEGWPEAIVADDDFQRLEAEYAELMRDPEANADALRAVEDAMNERGDAVAAALRQAAALQDLAARYPFLRLHDVEGWPEAIVADDDFQRLEAEYAELMRDPEANADALRAVEDAMNERGDAVAAALRQAAALQDLAARYPFLRLHDVEGWPEAIVADKDFQRLEAEYAELMRDPEANADALRAVEDAMNERGDAVAAALRQAAALQDLAARYPFLRLHDVEGWPEAIVADGDFQRLEAEYAELMRDPEANADALRAVEDAMNERGDAVAAALRQAAALQDLAARYPFLRLHDVEGWPEAIVADGDFQRLEAEYAELMRDPEANADALRAVEDAMNERGDAVAAALRQAAALQDLAARYPFLRLHDVEGWPEAIVADGDFQRLEAEYAELMRDPEANADALRAVEDAMNARGDAVAAALRQAAALQDLAARYPFLRLHDVEGWPEAIVADGDFQRLEAEYAELMRDPEANADALRAVEDAMNERGDAVAAALRQAAALQDLAARYPFLRLHDVEGWPEAIVADKDFQRLETEYAELMRDPEANADALRAVEDAMNERGDAVAAALRQAAALQDLAARYPFLRLHDVEGWPEAIVADGDFQRLEAEYAELMRDPEANADALRAVEDAMNERGDAVAAALRQAAALQDLAARYPFLRLHDVEGWPEAIVADGDFQRLEAEYAELMRDPEANADALRAVEDAMNARGDAVAAALRQAAALQDLAARYPFLRLHDVEGWPEAIVADGDFQRLEAEYAELMRDPEANADALRAVEDAMNARGDAVAAALRQAAALQDLAARYPFLRLHDVEGWPEAIVADGDFQRLEAEYAELMRDPEANADALRAVEDAMNARGDAVAAALRQAAALQDLAARYPFLRLHDVEGWPEAIVADGDFQRLEAEYAELMRDPEANADALRAVEDAMNERGDAVAAALRQAAALQDLAARYPFLRLHDVEGWPEAIVADGDFQRLEAEYAELMRDPEANADALRAVEDAMNARGDAVAAALRQAAALQDLAARYPFLRLHDVEGWPEAIVADGDFQRLEAEYAELMRDPEANADALRAVEDAMNERGDAVAAALRQAAALQDLAARYPFLRLHDVEGWPEAIVADKDFQRLETEYAELMRDPEANADALRAVEDAMNARGDAVAAALRQAAALQDLAARYPFLRLHDVEGWPEAIVADGDFQRLEAEYAELMRDPEANADALRAVEDAMNARGDAVAAALRQAAALQDLAARYPFLRLHDVEGWPEAIVADKDFQRLETEYAELMRDPEANADALRAVEDAMNERGDAVAAALRQAAALQDLAARYPFLRLHDVEGWPEAIVADGDFQRLEAEYAELMRDPEANADALRAVEDAMNERGDAVAAALRQAAALQDLAARYPFLRLHDVEGWPEAIVADKDFQRLETEYAELMRDPEANADALRAVEDAMNERGDAVAAALRQAAALQDLAARYPFLRLHDVEGWPEAIVADGDFQRLEAEYAELMRDPEANADALRAVEDAMNARGDAVAAALRQAAALQDLAARYPFLRLHDVEGWPEAIVADKDFQRLETEYAELMRDPEANADALRAVEDAMNERGDAVAAALRQAAALQDLAARYPFLRLHDVEGWPEAIVADGDFQRLEAEYAELMRDPEANADALRAVEDAMNARGDAVAAALRQAAALQDLAARYPFLRLHDVEGWPEAIVADKDFQRLETEYAELMRDPEANADALRAVEDAMNERGDAVAAALRQAAALQDLAARYPFLRLHDVEGWPEAIVADGDFQRLEAEYAELMRDPEANADALRAVEDAMNARGDAVAAALRQAAALQDLAARYPFLRLHDVEGWPEAIVADGDFQRLEAEYAELMRDPEANADALRAVEDAMNERGDAVAAALRQAAALQDLAARYPFLRLHDVEGWPEAIVADGDFQRLEAEYAELMRDPEANADALRAVEDAMNARGDAVAAALRQAAALQDLAARYPFLRLHDVEGWPEAIVADKDFQRLEAEYAELMRDPEANADALRAVEDAMNARGDAVAAALRQAAALQDLAARYPFLRLHDVEGWPEAIVADGDFQRLEAEYAELMRDPEANADALRAVEDAMNARGDAVAAALRQAAALQDLAARYPFLRLHDVEGWPEAIVADKDFQRLETEYAELMRDPEANADALRAVEDAMNERGDAVAAALRQAAALQDLAARYPFLRLHDVEGWPEAIVADGDFQRLEAEYAELMRDPEANADALRAVEDAMNARGDAVAAALRQAAALQDLAARYPFLRLHDVEGWPEAIVADDDFQRLEAEYAELMRDPEANADALRAVEDAMNERGDAVAAALRQAAALQDLAARYPFLRLHDVEGWPEAIVADDDFQRLETEYAELMRDPEANADALRAVEDAMNARGDAVAAALRQAAALQDLAARYPFLRLHDVEGWPEAIVADDDFQRLETEYAELMRDPEANADALRAVEDAMNARGDAVAAALRQAAALQDLAARYPFLRLHDVEGWPEAIVADDDFQRLEAEYAELMRDPEANADALRAVEDAMNARGERIAGLLSPSRFADVVMELVESEEAGRAAVAAEEQDARFATAVACVESAESAARRDVEAEEASEVRGAVETAVQDRGIAVRELHSRLDRAMADCCADEEAGRAAVAAEEQDARLTAAVACVESAESAARRDVEAEEASEVRGTVEAAVQDRGVAVRELHSRLDRAMADCCADEEAGRAGVAAEEQDARFAAAVACVESAESAARRDVEAEEASEVRGTVEAAVQDRGVAVRELHSRLDRAMADCCADEEAGRAAVAAEEQDARFATAVACVESAESAARRDVEAEEASEVRGTVEAAVQDRGVAVRELHSRLDRAMADCCADEEAGRAGVAAEEQDARLTAAVACVESAESAARRDVEAEEASEVRGTVEAAVQDRGVAVRELHSRLDRAMADCCADEEAGRAAVAAEEQDARFAAAVACVESAESAARRDVEAEEASEVRGTVEAAVQDRGVAVRELHSRLDRAMADCCADEEAGRAGVAAEEQDARLTAAVACVESAESAARRDVEAEEAAAAHEAAEAAVQDRGVAVRELHSRLDRAMADCCADEEAGRAAVAAEEQDARLTAAVACVESAESAARRDVEAEEASEVRGTVEAAVQDRGVAVRELHSRLDRAMADCCADEEAGRAGVAAEEQDARLTAAVACVESAESAARRDVEAEEAAAAHEAAEAAVQDRGVAVRELHSRLDRAMADCCADEEAGRAAVAAEKQDARLTAAVACVESAESAARRDVEAEEASEVRGTVEAAVQDRGVAVRELHSRLDRAMADCCADEEAGRAGVAAEEQDARLTAAVACVESAESAARRDVEAEEASEVRGAVEAAVQDRGVAVRELHSRLDRAMADCCADEEAGRAGVAAEEQDARLTAAVACVESAESAARRDVEAEEAAAAHEAAEAAVQDRGVAVRELHSRLDRAMADCCADEEAGRAAVAAEEQDARLTAAVACVESAESAARRDVEAEEAAAAHEAAEAAVQDRGVAVRELHSRLDRAMADCCADEEAGRAAVAAEEQDARLTAAVACVESAESAARRDVEAEEAAAAHEAAEAAVQDRGVAVRELHSRLDRAMADCCADEEAGRAGVAAEEQDARFATAVACVESAESAARRDVEAEEASEVRGTVEAAVQDRGVAVRELHSRLDRAMADCCADEEAGRAAVAAEEQDARFATAVACVESAESAARRDVEAEEAEVYGSLLQAEAEVRLETHKSRLARLKKQLRKCLSDEDKHRRVVEGKEATSRSALAESVAERERVHTQAVKRRNALCQDEALARTAVELDEKGDWVLLTEHLAALLSSMAETQQRTAAAAEAAARAESSTRLLQRVGRGHLLRRKLQCRLENRRREAHKRGVAKILADEFTQRRALAGEEYLARQELGGRAAAALALAQRGEHMSLALQELMVEESSERGRIASDAAAEWSAIERAEHKQFIKHNSAYVSAEATDSEADEEELEVPHLPVPQVNGLPSVESHGREKQRRSYKGFDLDALGQFLLDYESDLNRMQMELADLRRTVAFEHDQLKDARDRTVQEVVRGGTGAMWVPARPLPLSDLVRGPSAQYERRKRH